MEWRNKIEAKAKQRRKFRLRVFTIVVSLLVVAFVGWLIWLSGTPERTRLKPVPQVEMEHMIAALEPRKRPSRPVIAVLGINEGTETTDYLMPYGILKRADVADVIAVATRPGSITLFPALEVEPEATIDEFDKKYPEGADYVIVPAMARDDDPDAIKWIQRQAEMGGYVIGVCAGAMVVANAGLLDGKRATTHWYYVDKLLKKHPSIQYVKDRRFVADKGVMTTTGITASMPMSLTLIEAIGGREKAQLVASELGLTYWDARHSSDEFVFSRRLALSWLRNSVSFWKQEDLEVELTPGIDEVSLALVVDAWSRTKLSQVVAFAGSTEFATKNGLKLHTVVGGSGGRAQTRIELASDRAPAQQLDSALSEIGARYGTRTRNLVEAQLEYRQDR